MLCSGVTNQKRKFDEIGDQLSLINEQASAVEMRLHDLIYRLLGEYNKSDPSPVEPRREGVAHATLYEVKELRDCITRITDALDLLENL